MIGNKAVDAVESAEGAGISGRNREKQSTLSKKKVKEEPEEEPNDSNEDNGSGDDYDYEQEQVDELEELDDWGRSIIVNIVFSCCNILLFWLGSAWKLCKELGLKWGGRGMGGRATGRTTVQTKDVVVEGCTMAYLGNNLLERTTLRLLEGKKYGLIGRNGVGKRYIIALAHLCNSLILKLHHCV